MSGAIKVWIVDDDESIRWVLEKALQRDGMLVQSFPGAAELLDALAEDVPDVLICDIRMPGVNGLELMERVHGTHPELPVIIVTAHSDLDAAVAAFKGGAFEYLPKPFDVDSVASLVQRAAAKRMVVQDTGPLADRPAIIGAAPAMQDVFRAIGRLAASQITVLITGESGTGKELIARALHTNSPRASKPFIAINTAAIPKDLLESEFFGHERGAFTGAQMQRKGRFEQADGGTLFLDEIGDMPLLLQTRLLRVLEEREVVQLGSEVPQAVNLRVVSASHRNLVEMIQRGTFREDLYYRLNGITLELPPLAQRSDKELLIRQIIAGETTDGRPVAVEAEAFHQLLRYDWPGNIRELRNVIRTALAICEGGLVCLHDLPREIREWRPGSAMPAMAQPVTVAPQQAVTPAAPAEAEGTALEAAERAALLTAIEKNRWNMSNTAAQLRISRNTLYRKIKRHGIPITELRNNL